MAEEHSSPEGLPDLEQLQAQLAALPVGPMIASSASTLYGIAAAKLDAGDLEQARKAIDAFAALVPHVEGESGHEIRLALAQIQVAYATAASGGTNP